LQYGAAAQAIIQPSSGPIKPAMTFVQSSWDPYAYMTAAFKTTRGPVRPALQAGSFGCWRHGVPQGTPAMNWVFPCDSGNLLEFTYENNIGI